jgi:membrane-associated phospholipid phosphatase
MADQTESYLSKSNLSRGLLLAVIVALGYFIPDNFIVFPTHSVVLTRLDQWVELQPAWVWFYISYYPLLIAGYFMTTGHASQRVYFGAMSLASLVGFIVFFFFPTMVSRDLYPWTGANDVSAQMLTYIRGADVPVNCLPSMHVCMSFIAAACISMVSGRVGRVLLWAWFLAICYSTMATKQHYFVDLVAGFALGLTTVALFMKRYDVLPHWSDFVSQPGGPFQFSTLPRPSARRPRMARFHRAFSKLRRQA